MPGPVRVRFAPSPTGYLHVGGARTALFNWLFARQRGGRFILRLEDTDQARNTEAARSTIFDGLKWLGLEPDEGPLQGGPFGPYCQSERGELYRKFAATLKERGRLYPCFCSRERLAALRREQEQQKLSLAYDRRCRDLPGAEVRARVAAGERPTWRLAVPEGETILDDLVRGRIQVQHADVEDIILIRGDGTPVYNLAVVIDDHLMEISHVLRGEDHLTNTFKQLLLYQALGWDAPRFGHLPLILGPTGEGKLSKRRHPEAALEHYQRRGFAPEAMLNWLALIGWSLDDKTTIVPRQQLLESFSLERVKSSGARLPLDKLEAIGGHYMRAMSLEDLASGLAEVLQAEGWSLGEGARARHEMLHLAGLLAPRLHAFGEARQLLRWLFEPLAGYESKALKNLLKHADTPALLRAYGALLPDPLPPAAILEAQARSFASSRGLSFGRLVHPVRAALTGCSAGLPLFDCLELLGREQAHARLLQAAAFASSSTNLP